jgi:ribosomal protein L44E
LKDLSGVSPTAGWGASDTSSTSMASDVELVKRKMKRVESSIMAQIKFKKSGQQKPQY